MQFVQLLPLLALGATALTLQSAQEAPLWKKHQKTPIWVFYDNHGDGDSNVRLFGNLTFEAIEQRIDPHMFELKVVSSKNVKDHLPDIEPEFFRLYDAAKSDFLRANLIAKHGGIYMDGDIIVNEDFQELWDELEKQKSETMVYLSPGQSCNKQFTTNFMMGRKNNRMCMQWADEIRKGLKSRCEYTSDRDDVNGVCCYNPDGSARKDCHIPWGRISRPQTEGVTYAKGFGFKTKLASHACIGAERGFGVDDDTGEMLFKNTLEETESDSPNACWMDGADLVCKDGRRMINFMKRSGYHLYSSINYQQRQASRDELLFGPKKTVARALFRHLLLGEDTFKSDAGKVRCGAKSEDFENKTDYKSLSLIHIPRTGGTAVEACTITDPNVNEKWGVQNPNLHGLTRLSKTVKAGSCYKQHVPPALFASGENPYAGKETFCIVRNPYQRVISQFKFELSFYKTPSECSVEELNNLIKRRLNAAIDDGKKFAADCHWLPQSYYVYGVDNQTLALDTKQRSCDNVLNYENLHKPLNALMKEHNYPYQLSDSEKSGMSVSDKCKLSVSDMDAESRQLIEKFYGADFKLFGYEKHQKGMSALQKKVKRANDAPVSISCESIEKDKASSKDSQILFEAAQPLCKSKSFGPMMSASVHPAFVKNYHHFYDKNGWTDEAFVNYVGNIPEERKEHDFLAQTGELIKSVHMFSQNPIVVFVFPSKGQKIPAEWTPERYPQLVVFISDDIPKDDDKFMRTNFNFNKMRAMMLLKARAGIQLDSDQFILNRTSYLFQRTREEITEQYPIPMLPVHWMTKDDTMGDEDHPYKVYDFHCPECPKRTMRWGQAHPTWTTYALPWIGKWLYKAFSEEYIYGQKFLEDEDLMNVAFWADGATKQWCKFDTTPGDVGWMYQENGEAPNGAEIPRFDDPKWYPGGIVQWFATCHGSKNVTLTRRQLVTIDKREKKGDVPWLAYKNKAYAHKEDVPAKSDIKCLF